MTQSNESLFLGHLKKILILSKSWSWHENGLLSKVYMILLLMSQYVYVFLQFAHIRQIWGDIESVSETIIVLFTQATVCVKATVFIVNQKLFVTLLNTMNSEVFEPQSEEILKAASQNTRKLCTFLLWFMFSTSVLWSFMPLMDNAANRSFPLKVWMPVSTESSPGYELGYLYQVVTLDIGAAYFVVIDLLIYCMIMFGCTQIDVILHRLEQVQSIPVNMKNGEDRDEIIKRNNQLLVECIRRHQAISWYIQNVENVFSINIFFQLFGTVVIICMIGITITLLDTKGMQFVSMCISMVTMLMQLYLFCWVGDKINEKSEILRDHLYLCPWYDQDIKYRRIMLIAMECMKNPIVFRAGHYVPLSRSTFVSLLRASYSYFAVLNEMQL